MTRTKLIFLAFAAFALVDGFLAHAAFSRHDLSIQVLAAGKGSAVLVTAPSGRTLLYGTGSDASILRALGQALPYGVRKIDVVVVPTSASSEQGGEVFIKERYHIGYELTPQNALRGEKIDLGGATVTVLFPDRPLASGGSVVLALQSGSSTALLDHASAAQSAWVAKLNEQSGLAAALRIATSTPPGVYRIK